ncbi:MAG: ribonuclease J [Chloroflexi bacterium AL-W]|nr:ribonuclease J [Chloroflexi bacterium AL-N1]NOK65113.1 ribonuclease J [Chloroflexi bacterium AL-N10]NOK72620.1 ribonuclease J [Chloroflexi bacterium AL-N5]NOK79292.1 ribonuclease J [Chloroflexi bacterium AL-W]NOK87208.1 ribonuclease J [Chloroflexi bacterium AL-N15]
MWVLEYGEEIVLLDCGVMFPEDDMLGIDLVLPDITYLREQQHKIKAILLTHGHEDHIGATPYLLADLGFPPIYGTSLTIGLVSAKLKERRLLDQATLNRFEAGDTITIDSFKVEPFHVAHSIPDTVGLAITTPAGLAVYLTDWKFDHTPVDGLPTDITKMTELGLQSPLVLITDCVRVESKGYTPSEQAVGEAFDNIFATAPGRIIIASFASNIGRVQQAIDSAEAYGRKVLLVGRSMENNSRIARDLGYLRVEQQTLIRPNEAGHYPDDQIAVICTGSQGEPLSALARMANRDYPHVKIKEGDTVVVSATPIPGNEISVSRVINNLFRLGADVIYGNNVGVHVSGHAAQEELKMVVSMLKPEFIVPFHGDYRHMVLYRRLIGSMQQLTDEANIILPENGAIMEFSRNYGKVIGKAQVGYVYVDGTTVGDVGNVVVRDRQMLSRDGILMVVVSIDRSNGTIVAGPDIVSRGFVYMRQSDDLIDSTKEVVREAFKTHDNNGKTELNISFVGRKIKDVVSEHLYAQTKRRPMVLPMVMEV